MDGSRGQRCRADRDRRPLLGPVGQTRRAMADSLGSVRRADMRRRRLRVPGGTLTAAPTRCHAAYQTIRRWTFNRGCSRDISTASNVGLEERSQGQTRFFHQLV